MSNKIFSDTKYTINRSPSYDEVNMIEQSLDEEHEPNCCISSEIIKKSITWYCCKYEVFLFMENNKPIGFVEWRESTDQHLTNEVTILGFLIIRDLRGKGLGKRFYEMFEQYLRERKYKTIYLSCKVYDSCRFWEDKCLFTKCSEEPDTDTECYHYNKTLIYTT